MPDVDFWQNRYETESTPWDLGEASPHFVSLLEGGASGLNNALKPPLTPGKMAVLGCGRGHDAALFAQAGFDVVGFDYAPAAIREAQALYGQMARFQQLDILKLGLDRGDSTSMWTGYFDYVLEHTCFCAISPADRPAYVQAVKTLLKPGGLLLGLFWETGEQEEGPPYNTLETDVRSEFRSGFEVVSVQDLKPALGRGGVERLTILRRSNER